MKAALAALLSALLTSCSLVADGQAPRTHPATILVIRHAEKPADDTDIHLGPEGKKRARALPDLFRKSARRPDPFPLPDFIFATKNSRHSSRPVETVTPLAKKLGLDINTSFADHEFAKLVHELYTNPKYGGKTVLICWRHGTIPDLVLGLGATGVPDKWKDHVFDRVWVVTFDEQGKAKALVKRDQALKPVMERE